MSVKVRPYRGHKEKFEVDIRFEWPDGSEYRERVKAPVSSLSGARRWGETRERDLLMRGKARPKELEVAPVVVPTLAEFLPRYWTDYAEANQQKPSTVIASTFAVNRHLVPALGDKPLDTITDADIARLKGRMSTRAAKTVNNVLCLLATVLKAAKEWGVIGGLPCTIRLLKAHKTDADFLEVEEYERLVEAARGLDERKHILVLLCGDTGLRRGEAIALRWENVDFVRGVLKIVESETRGAVTTPKSGRSRQVPMTQRLVAALKAHRHLVGPRVLYADREDESAPPKGLTAKTVTCWVQSAEKRAGLPSTGKVHVLRHTYCSHLAMAGVPVTVIQAFAGHSELTTTMRYMHLSPSSRVDAVKLLEASRVGFGEMLEKDPEKENATCKAAF